MWPYWSMCGLVEENRSLGWALRFQGSKLSQVAFSLLLLPADGDVEFSLTPVCTRHAPIG